MATPSLEFIPLSEQIERLSEQTESPINMDVALSADPLASQTDIDSLMKALLALQPMTAPPPQREFDFEESFEKYSDRLKPFLSQSTRPSFYDLASDLGRALLSADPTTGAFTSAGIGFSNFADRMRKQKESDRLLNRQIGLEALKLANADEQAAKKFLNEKELLTIENENRPYEPLIYEVPNPSGGEPIQVRVDPRNPAQVAAIEATPGARQVKLPTSQVTVEAPQPETTGQKEAAKDFRTFENELAQEAKKAASASVMTQQFLVVANRLGEEGFGRIQAGTLGARAILDELGIRYDSSLDDQILAQSLGTRISMALVGQTKGAISNAEMALFLAASPSLASTYQGAVRQAEFLQRISNLQMKMAEDWARDADSVLAGIDALDSETKLRAARNWEINWRKNNPFLREDEIRELQEAAKKETPESRGYREALRPNTLSDDGLVTDFS
tara:strand:- start:460 stop:1800 length:1341 start_codon:yes stop_codon:yes gene_type:complete